MSLNGDMLPKTSRPGFVLAACLSGVISLMWSGHAEADSGLTAKMNQFGGAKAVARTTPLDRYGKGSSRDSVDLTPKGGQRSALTPKVSAKMVNGKLQISQVIDLGLPSRSELPVSRKVQVQGQSIVTRKGPLGHYITNSKTGEVVGGPYAAILYDKKQQQLLGYTKGLGGLRGFLAQAGYVNGGRDQGQFDVRDAVTGEKVSASQSPKGSPDVRAVTSEIVVGKVPTWVRLWNGGHGLPSWPPKRLENSK